MFGGKRYVFWYFLLYFFFYFSTGKRLENITCSPWNRAGFASGTSRGPTLAQPIASRRGHLAVDNDPVFRRALMARADLGAFAAGLGRRSG
jgi:hypothetical protein